MKCQWCITLDELPCGSSWTFDKQTPAETPVLSLCSKSLIGYNPRPQLDAR